jgi:cytochrome c peroxidase
MSSLPPRCLSRRSLSAACALAAALFSSPAGAQSVALAETLHEPAAEHVEQAELAALVRAGRHAEAFELAFEVGDELFETVFNALDGVGANVGSGERFTRVPRADLAGFGEWADHFPARETGPNASNCNACHNVPVDDGAGFASGNVHRDPLHSADLARMIQRNTPHVFAPGAVQRLAEEVTQALGAQRAAAGRAACQTGQPAPRDLVAKGVSFGRITALPTGSTPCADFDTSELVGVDPDLVVRPFQWKGSVAFLRDFNRGASHNELGMQPVETTGDGIDGDGDGIADELGIGDQTALAVYLAAQPRPTTQAELARLGLIEPLPDEQVEAIDRGARSFAAAGCADCHVPRLWLDDPVFTEPSQHAAYRDAVFPAGQDPVEQGVDPRLAVRFDLTRDQPDNRITDARGRLVFHLGALSRDARGRTAVDLFGDLRRHDMGPELAESIDEKGTGAPVFLTENLWGVGSTAPYLHDGRATTLAEAIALHGGEAAPSRDAFEALGEARQRDVIAFLENLVLFKQEEPAAEPAPPAHDGRHRSRRR